MTGFIDPILAFIRETATYFAAFAALALIVKRGAIFAAYRRCRIEAQTNMGLAAFNALVLVPLTAVPIAALTMLLDGKVWFEAFWERLPAALVVIGAIVIVDFAAYWRHRLEHSVSLWRYHATHHADTALHWLSVQRKHPVAKLLSMVIDMSLVLLLGFPLWAIFAAMLVRSWWGYFIHADVPWTLGVFGSVLISPAAHRLHHIRDEELMGTNYGNTITLWDKLFGTWCDPAPYLDCETGIAEGTRGLWGELKRPWEARYRARRAPEPAASEEVAA